VVELGEAVLVGAQVEDLLDASLDELVPPAIGGLVLVVPVDDEHLGGLGEPVEERQAHIDDVLVGGGELEAGDEAGLGVLCLAAARGAHEGVLVVAVEALLAAVLGGLGAPGGVGVVLVGDGDGRLGHLGRGLGGGIELGGVGRFGGVVGVHGAHRDGRDSERNRR
jgi:hypothetical protein